MNIVLENFTYYAVPGNEGTFSRERLSSNGYSRSFEAESPAALKALILQCSNSPRQGHVAAKPAGAGEGPGIASQLRMQAPENVEYALNGIPAPDHRPPWADPPSDPARVTSDVASLEDRIAAVESRVSEFYQSRTWQALTGVGGVLQSVARMLRLSSPGRR